MYRKYCRNTGGTPKKNYPVPLRPEVSGVVYFRLVRVVRLRGIGVRRGLDTGDQQPRGNASFHRAAVKAIDKFFEV